MGFHEQAGDTDGNGGTRQDRHMLALTTALVALPARLFRAPASAVAARSAERRLGSLLLGQRLARRLADDRLRQAGADLHRLRHLDARQMVLEMGDEAGRQRMAAAATAVRERFSAARVLGLWEELFAAVTTRT